MATSGCLKWCSVPTSVDQSNLSLVHWALNVFRSCTFPSAALAADVKRTAQGLVLKVMPRVFHKIYTIQIRISKYWNISFSKPHLYQQFFSRFHMQHFSHWGGCGFRQNTALCSLSPCPHAHSSYGELDTDSYWSSEHQHQLIGLGSYGGGWPT